MEEFAGEIKTGPGAGGSGPGKAAGLLGSVISRKVIQGIEEHQLVGMPVGHNLTLSLLRYSEYNLIYAERTLLNQQSS